jgi:hypothetical protein
MPDPDFLFIPDPASRNNNKRGGGKTIVALPFL